MKGRTEALSKIEGIRGDSQGGSEKARELHALLKDWRKSVNAQMPTPNLDYQPKEK